MPDDPGRSPATTFMTEVALPLAGLISLCLIDYFVFRRLFHSNYLRWYLNAGPFIALATAAFGVAWGGLDNNVGLISANPLRYIRACKMAAGLPIYVFGGIVLSKNQPQRISLRDILFGLPLIVVFVIAAMGWLLFMAPIQYFVFLICGAPSRIVLSSNYAVYAKIDGRRLIYEDNTTADPKPEKGKGWDASMRDKPVTLANAFSGVTLFLLARLLS
ncbi:MAG TPA: hypothetical protein VGJ55_06940 [Pyrinomonadaceae bacterium]